MRDPKGLMFSIHVACIEKKADEVYHFLVLYIMHYCVYLNMALALGDGTKHAAHGKGL